MVISRIFLARSALVAVLLVGAGFLVDDRLEKAQESALVRIHFEVVESNRRINILFDAARTVLDSIGEYVDAGPEGRIRIDPRMDRLLSRSIDDTSVLAGAIVQDLSGRIVATGAPHAGLGLVLPELDFFKRAIGANSAVYEVGAPYDSAILKTRLIPLAKGIRDSEGRVVAVASVGIRMSNVQTALGPAIATSDARSRLWRRDGLLLASSADDNVEIGRHYPSLPLFSAKEAGATGTFVAHSPLTGEVRLSAWRDNAFFPVFVSTGANRSQMLDRDYIEAIWICGFVGVVLTLFFVAIALVDRERQRTIQALSEKTRALSVKNMFLANMSHEFRTPLNAMSGYLQMLRMGIYGALDQRQSQAIDSAKAATDHLADLTETLLDLSRIEAGKMALDKNPVELNALIKGAVTLVKPQAEAREIEVVIREFVPTELRAICDPLRSRQIVINLLSNAIRHCRPAGQVVVEVSVEKGEKVGVRVLDDGPGFRASPLERYFEPFSERDPLVAHAGGTGLGLSLSRALARIQGGDLTIANRKEGGAVATLELPIDSAKTVPA